MTDETARGERGGAGRSSAGSTGGCLVDLAAYRAARGSAGTLRAQAPRRPAIAKMSPGQIAHRRRMLIHLRAQATPVRVD